MLAQGFRIICARGARVGSGFIGLRGLGFKGFRDSGLGLGAWGRARCVHRFRSLGFRVEGSGF